MRLRVTCARCSGPLLAIGLDAASAVEICPTCRKKDRAEIDQLVAASKAQADRLASMGGSHA